ncbi:hypothetical protein HAX54_050337 [Datura stramonium]|uniref:Phytocyanin domain-containing protein n=1 Tax=Datura stramonium TaxID=4076 RepID=A0ABS8WQ39_DATST|nr:hypothetical protein [Datura stramonium]
MIFRYKIGSDSVLVVDKDDYTKCNKDKPILQLKHGNSKFTFESSGPFYFTSGHEDNCEKGQKLMVVVCCHPTTIKPKQPRAQHLLNPLAQFHPLPSPAPASSGAPEGFIGGF